MVSLLEKTSSFKHLTFSHKFYACKVRLLTFYSFMKQPKSRKTLHLVLSMA